MTRYLYIITALVSGIILLGLTMMFPGVGYVLLLWLIILGIAVGEARGKVR